MGPVEVVALVFPGNRFSGTIIPALQAAVDKGAIRVIDLAFVTKDADGGVATRELVDLSDEEAMPFDPLVHETPAGLLSAEDIQRVGESLDANSSAALLLFEHAWAADLRQAVLDSGGQLILQERVPPETLEAALAATAASGA